MKHIIWDFNGTLLNDAQLSVNDYTVAIEEGANIVRVGTALFGQRDYSLKF
mgnify:CR=1 FL=1